MAEIRRSRTSVRRILLGATAIALALSGIGASFALPAWASGGAGQPSTGSASLVGVASTVASTVGGREGSWWQARPAVSALQAAEARLGPEPTPTAPIATAPASASASKASGSTTPAVSTNRPVSLGTNHFSFPAAGISSLRVSYWDCARVDNLPNAVYRWGCAGSNNTYLLGHAYGVFKPLNAAYHSGALRVGAIAYYAGSDGTTRAYRVTTIRRELIAREWDWRPWAAAAQPVRSLTLMTCDDAKSEYRILVRLVEVP